MVLSPFPPVFDTELEAGERSSDFSENSVGWGRAKLEPGLLTLDTVFLSL